jgi:cation transporter-like permease
MLISLLISLIVLCLVVGVVFWLLTLLPVPQPFLNIIKVCIVLIVLLYVLSMFTGYTHPFYLYR